ncbi:HlyD family efflux transporter periplasmic adaptor subunit [Thalassomonas sp. M1454]|nr:HlyD family efflux transporter periplasmic adaptor subunit [Thalassomonas sp. M1454]
MSLFRKEAIAHQEERLNGTIILTQPLSIRLTSSILVAIAALIVVFLFNAEYTRKETVSGFIVPNKGVIKSYAVQGGTIEKLLVNDGDFVKKGQPLVSITVRKNNTDGLDVSEESIVQLKNQEKLLSEEISRYIALQEKELLNSKVLLSILNSEKPEITNQLNLINEKLHLLNKQQEQFNQLNNNGHLSNIETERRQQNLIEAKQEKQNIVRLLLKHERDKSQILFNIESIPLEYALHINNVRRQKSEVQQQISKIKSNHQYTVTASHSGTITGIQVVAGETLKQNKPLLNILPEGSELIAELLLPTRSAGFVEQGHIAHLRFDAFPYQRFGFIKSKIFQIDKALIMSNDVQFPIKILEPVYRIKASLDVQQIHAYGKGFPLKSGMLFKADILLDKRSLIEWILEPIYSLTGRIS